jgi:hypothetical protein
MNPEPQEEKISSHTFSSISQSRWWKLIWFALILGGLTFGGYGIWLALKNTPMNPPPLSSFIAFAIAVVLLTYDNLADQPKEVVNKKYSIKDRTPPAQLQSEPAYEVSPPTGAEILAVRESPKREAPIKAFVQKDRFSEDDTSKSTSSEGEPNASLLRQLSELKEENRRLREMYLNLSLEYQMLKELHDKKKS